MQALEKGRSRAVWLDFTVRVEEAALYPCHVTASWCSFYNMI